MLSARVSIRELPVFINAAFQSACTTDVAAPEDGRSRCKGLCRSSWLSCTEVKRPGQSISDVKFEQYNVAILHHVFLAFHTVKSLFPGAGGGAAFHQIVESHGFGLDEPALEIGVNHARGLG